MKTAAIILCLFVPIASAIGQELTAEIVIDDIYWNNDDEWNAEIHAVLYFEGDSISSSGYTHYWYHRENGEGPFTPYTSNGYGQLNEIDQHGNESYDMYVVIYVPWDGNVQSPSVELVKYGNPEAPNMYQQLQGGSPSTAGNSLVWSGRSWRGQLGGTQFMSDGDLLKAVLGQPNGQRFHRGMTFSGDVRYLNYDSYPIYYHPDPAKHLNNDVTFHLRPAYDATLTASLIDNPAIIEPAKFQDPWLEDLPGAGGEYKSSGMSAPFRSIEPGQNNIGLGSANKGVFLDQDPITVPNYYSVAAPPQTMNGIEWIFESWSATGADGFNATNSQTPIVFRQSGATVTANYKAHLATGNSSTGFSKNQRRVLSSGSYWAMIYESVGDIWLTTSSDGGSTWSNEIRLNDRVGYGSNPTLSDITSGSGGNLYFVAGWLEQYSSGNYEIHLQSLKFNWTSGIWGWESGTSRSSSNHKTLGQINASLAIPSSSARITLAAANTSPRTIIYSYEKNSSGLVAGEIAVPTDLSNAYAQSGIGTGIQLTIKNGGQQANGVQPVVIYYPSMYGYPARKSVYFLASGYASGYRIAEWHFSLSGPVNLIAGPYGDYTYFALQGASNPSGASFGLVAVSSVYSSGPQYRVSYYHHPTYYGTSPPSLVSSFNGYALPSMMVENTSNFGSPTAEIVFRDYQGTNWRKTSPYGPPSVFTDSSLGVFTREQVGSGDRKSIANRTTNSPYPFQVYSGSGVLQKSDSNPIRFSRTFNLVWIEDNGDTSLARIKLGKSNFILSDSSHSGGIPFLKVGGSLSSGINMMQVGETPKLLEISIFRAGRRSHFLPSEAWKNRSSAELGEIQVGDLMAILPNPVAKSIWGYMEFTPISSESDLDSDSFTSLSESEAQDGVEIDIYPNPFNPTTTFRIILREMGDVSLKIYDILGREVGTITNGFHEAGSYSFPFNATNLSTGIYIYRLVTRGQAWSGRISVVR